MSKTLLKNNLRTICILYGLGMIICLVTIMIATFIYAYLSPNKETLVTINHYGEGIPDLIVIITAIPFIIYSMLYITKNIKKRSTS